MTTAFRPLRPLIRVMSLVLVFLLTLTLLALPQTQPSAQAQTGTTPPQNGSGICGGSIALVFDLSGHIDATELTNVKNAARTLVQNLSGSPYQIALFNYSDTAPAVPARVVPATSVRDQAGVNRLVDNINALSLPARGSNFHSNWEGSLREVRNAMTSGANFNHVFFLAGGPPTRSDAGTNDGWFRSYVTEEGEVQAAQDMSNAIRQLGAEVIPVGIGTGITNTTVQVYPDQLFGLFNPTPTRADAILRSVATTSTRAITVTNEQMGTLPRLMTERAVATCIQVNKQIVDGDGNVIEPGVGWTFDAAISGAPTGAALSANTMTTGAQGRTTTRINGFGSGALALTLTERQQNSHIIHPVNGRAAQCVIHRPGNGTFTASVTAAGDSGVRLDVQAMDTVTCTFSNRPQVPLRLVKSVSADAQPVQDEVGGLRFDFAYVCTDAGRTIREGSINVVRPDLTVTLAERVPVGAECTITEARPSHDPNRHRLTTSWEVTGGTPVQTSADGLTYRFRVNTPAAGSGGAGVTVGVRNSYSAYTGMLTLRKVVPEGNLPDAQIPTSTPIRYFCRYVPDPNSRPELDSGAGNPGFVASGYTSLPRNGETQIGPFPVGTQCGFEEEGADGSTPDVPGYSFTGSWASNACLDYRDASASGIRECQANYIRIPQAGNYILEVTNTYQRQTADLTITKEVTGDAAERGREQRYTFDVVCTDATTESFSQTGVSVVPGLPTRIPGVPVASDCTVTETGPPIPGVDVVTQIEPATVHIAEAGVTYSVNALNSLTYQRGELRLDNRVEIEGIDDPLILAELRTAEFDIQARCWEPGSTTAVERTVSVVDGQTASFGSFPVGTSCVLTETYVPPSGVAHHPRFSPTSVVVDSVAGVTVNLLNHFTPVSLGLMIHNDAGMTASIPDADVLLPRTFTYTIRCEGHPEEIVTLADGDMEIIEGIPAGSECQITGTVDDNDALERVTSWRGTDAGGTVTGESGANTFSFTVAFPWDDSDGVAVNVLHTFAPALQPVTVIKDLTIQNADGSAVSPEIRDAVVPQGQGVLISYVCTRNGFEIARASRVLEPGESRQPALPVNAECAFTAGQQPLVSAERRDTVWSGSGTDRGDAYLITVTADGLHTVEVENVYVLKTGGFNLKKKVDGEGVSTIHRDRIFPVAYVCSLNGVVIDEGVLQPDRFDAGQEHQVAAIPVGSECTLREDPSGAQEDNAQWSSRWTLAAGPTGWETEQSCVSVANCRPDPEQHYQVTLTIADRGEGAANEHFQGTLVVWNTYTYDKVRLDVSKELAGDGPVLAANDEFVFLYTCTDPRFEGSELDDQPYIPDPTITGTLRVTGQGQAVEMIQDPANPDQSTTAASKEIPVGYTCTIQENPVAAYDAEVTTSFQGADIPEGQNTDPTQTWVEGNFSTLPEYAETTQPLTVINSYERARADLVVSTTYDTQVTGTVHEYLTNPGAPYLVDWQCMDPIRSVTYEGTVEVPPNGNDVHIRRAGLPEGVDTRLPASAICAMTEQLGNRIPPGFENVVTTSQQARWLEADTDGQFTQRAQRAGTTIEDVTLVNGGTTRIAFTNTYVVPQSQIGVGKVVEGDDNGQVFPLEGEAAEQYRFGFTYECRFPLLPGQPEPFPAEGTFDLSRGDSWRQDVPVGTTCAVTEEAPDTQVEQRLEDFQLRYQPNYAYSGAGSPTDLIRTPLDPETSFTLEAQPGEGGVIEPRNIAIIFNSLYRGSGEVLVRKVNPGGEPLEGAAFAIHPVTENGEMAPEPVIADVPAVNPDSDGPADFSADLVPGTYYLVETRSGTEAELLPRPWRFTVRSVSTEDELGDLRIELSDYDRNSGLITVEEPDTDDDPWIIRVANIASGELPLTGGHGIWPGLLVGLGLLLAAAVWSGSRRSER